MNDENRIGVSERITKPSSMHHFVCYTLSALCCGTEVWLPPFGRSCLHPDAIVARLDGSATTLYRLWQDARELDLSSWNLPTRESHSSDRKKQPWMTLPSAHRLAAPAIIKNTCWLTIKQQDTISASVFRIILFSAMTAIVTSIALNCTILIANWLVYLAEYRKQFIVQ